MALSITGGDVRACSALKLCSEMLRLCCALLPTAAEWIGTFHFPWPGECAGLHVPSFLGRFRHQLTHVGLTNGPLQGRPSPHASSFFVQTWPLGIIHDANEIAFGGPSKVAFALGVGHVSSLNLYKVAFLHVYTVGGGGARSCEELLGQGLPSYFSNPDYKGLLLFILF